MNEPDSTTAVIQALGVNDRAVAERCVRAIHGLSLPEDLLEQFWHRLVECVRGVTDVDRVLTNLEAYIKAVRSPYALLAFFERDPAAFETLVQLFSTSQYMADTLIADPEVFDLLRLTEGKPVDKSVLLDEILSEVEQASDVRTVMRILRDYRHRETLRIAYGDFLMGQPVEVVTQQISNLTDAIIQAAVVASERDLKRRGKQPKVVTESDARFCVVALGKLGGAELNYSSDVDLIFVGHMEGYSNLERNQLAASEYFERLGQLIIRLLSESTSRGAAYRVDMRLRPYGQQGSLVVDFNEGLHYYDSHGRTWERQAFVKARPIAGDLEMGQQWIDHLQPWIYRRYLSRADIAGLSALKRRIEKRSREAGDDDRNVKFGHGGIRDIEFVIQFLQLLNGGDLPAVRSYNTLEAIRLLHAAGCITAEEQSVLENNYRFLRRIEHCLQITYNQRVHSIPNDALAWQRVAWQMGYRDRQEESAEFQFCRHLTERTDRNRRILDHLLHEAFTADDIEAAAETDLVLDPEPTQETIRSVLVPYGFADPDSAYKHLMELSRESISFLSTRRCRHFLSAIAPNLLSCIAETPNPDQTLVSLANISESLGGKAVLWELFSVNPPSMKLCVRICAGSPYLVSILTSNPGMIDELMDSLMLDHLPTLEEMDHALSGLCRGAEDIAPIVRSFKNSMHLRVGARELLGMEDIASTHETLSNIAEVCLEQVIYHEFHRLIHRLGLPRESGLEGSDANEEQDSPMAKLRPSKPNVSSLQEGMSGEAAELVVLAVGKLGGREPNYHSDLDVIFLFDGEGYTSSLVPSRRFEPTTNRHFFNQLSQRVISSITRTGTGGKLFDIDVRLRPQGRSGELAITIGDLERYFSEGGGQIWERQALCKARPVWGSNAARQNAVQSVRRILQQTPWSQAAAMEIYQHRLHLQRGAARNNIKRGPGGTMDIEFIVQSLQLAHAAKDPKILVPGTLDAIEQLSQAGILHPDRAQRLHLFYRYLRLVESGIRLMNLTARHQLPTPTFELDQLAFLLSTTQASSIALELDELIGTDFTYPRESGSELTATESVARVSSTPGQEFSAERNSGHGLQLYNRCGIIQQQCRQMFEQHFRELKR